MQIQKGKRRMKDIIEINIKSLNQTVSVALAEFLVELDKAKFAGVKIIKVITGYGSHGKGGEIKKELNILLNKLKREKRIKNYYLGESLSKENISHLFEIFPSIVIDNELSSYNSGVTIVEV